MNIVRRNIYLVSPSMKGLSREKLSLVAQESPDVFGRK